MAPDVPEKFVELVEGELIEMTPADWSHNRLASEFEFLFREYCKTHPGLDYGGDNDGFLIARNPDTVLSPDASLFVRREISGRPWRQFAPEVVVEILSPSTTKSELAFKRHRYFAAGTQQFWLVDLENRRIEFYFNDDRLITADGDAVVECEGIASGLRLNIEVMFQER